MRSCSLISELESEMVPVSQILHSYPSHLNLFPHRRVKSNFNFLVSVRLLSGIANLIFTQDGFPSPQTATCYVTVLIIAFPKSPLNHINHSILLNSLRTGSAILVYTILYLEYEYIVYIEYEYIEANCKAKDILYSIPTYQLKLPSISGDNIDK